MLSLAACGGNGLGGASAPTTGVTTTETTTTTTEPEPEVDHTEELIEQLAEASEMAGMATAKLSDGGELLELSASSILSDSMLRDGLKSIEEISRFLGFPESVIRMIGSTSANDGFQNHDTDDYTLTWWVSVKTGLGNKTYKDLTVLVEIKK